MKKILLLGCIMLFVLCGGRKTTVETEGLEEIIVFEEEPQVSTEPVLPSPPEGEAEVIPPPPIEEEPMIKEEVAIIPPPVEEEISPPPVVEETYVPPPTTPVPPTAPVEVYGFRIQIFASSTENNAAKVADDARGAFGVDVYVEYVPPYYKVRVGNCLTEKDALTLKNKALQLGYRGAFIVETMITP
ncbi:MAG: SPOR domain-containing protein [candidate division WOR-3 bacterium]|nr:MAG: SPOR domain-containing protein [candidate division WOR-3 bacterium]